MPPRPGAVDAPGELVFVSYSHEDAAWKQRFEVLLKPLLRTRRLRLWVDTSLRGGDAWRPEIEAAIGRSAAALLLVSADLLASDFVMDEELPALRRHGVRLLPVLVGACLWEDEPALADVQWLHDPGRDGPLGRDAGDPSRRDERLVAICRRLVAALPGAPVTETRSTPTLAPDTVAAVPAGPSSGDLSGVPEDPPGYIVRDELAALIAAVTATDTGGAVGVTAEAPVGLFGQGGIGKSVLAAALGRDGRIRHRFPDGVFWVTVGERPDVLAVQLDLLARLGDTGPAPRTIRDATTQLRDLVRERRVLLLVDDVWSDAAAHAFRVTGPRGRVVYTTRERQVVAAVGAREYAIGVLSPAAARAVAAAVLDVAAGTLPETADRAFAEVGRVALAVALLAAAVRGGRSWDAVAAELRREVDVYGDHPYANTFKAMQIAVATLPTGLAAALLGLAVFPPDTAVPVAAVARYWAHTRGAGVDTSADLDRLAAANVLRREGDEIGFHDLQHDYLLLHSPGLPALHADLLDAYRAVLPPAGRDGWWALPPDEPYVWDHLVAHLAGAGDRRAVADTATDPAFLARRVGGGGLHGAEADLARAGELLPEHPLIAWWRRWLARHASFLAGSGAALRESVTPTVLAWLQADPTRPAEVDPERLTPVLSSPYLTVRWGLRSPEPALVRVLAGHTDWVQTVDWSPDGALVASGADDGTLRVWEPGTGRFVAVVDHQEPVRAVAWSPDGGRLAVAADSGLQLYGRDGEPAGATAADVGELGTVAWAPDGGRLAAGGHHGVFLVDARGGRPPQHLDTTDVRTVGWSPVGDVVLTAHGHDVRLWNPVTGRRVGEKTGLGVVNALSWSPDGTRVACGGSADVRIWTRSDDTVAVLRGHTSFIDAVAWSPRGDRVATGGRDRQVRVWDLATGRSQTLTGHTDWVRDVAWSPDGTRLATAGDDDMVFVWDADVARSSAASDRPLDWIRAVAVTGDGASLATLEGDPYGSSRYAMRVWDTVTGVPVTATVETSMSDDTVVWSDDETVLVAGGFPPLRRWRRATDRATPIENAEDAGGDAAWACVAWSAGGTRLAVAFDDRIRIRREDEPGPTVDLALPIDAGTTTALAWSADATRLAAARVQEDGRKDIVVWEIAAARVEATLPGNGRGSDVLAWSPDGRYLAVATGRVPVVLWEPARGRTTTLARPVGVVTGLAWSPDGTFVATTEDEGSVAVQRADRTSCTRLQLAGANCIAWEGDTIVVGQRTGPAVLELRTPGRVYGAPQGGS